MRNIRERPRRPAWFLLLPAMALAVAACSANATEDDAAEAAADVGAEDDEGGSEGSDESDTAEVEDREPVTLEFFNFTAGADHEDKLAAIIDEFETANPHITIDAKNAGFEEYFTQLQTRIAGGVAPDTFELNYENFVSYAGSGSLLDLEAAAPGTIDPSVYFPRAYDAFNHEGTQYGLPESFSVVVLYYNERLFDEAGLDYPDETWTWEDEQEAAEEITALGDDIWGVYQPIQFFEFYKALAQSGGEFFSPDGTEATFNGPEGVEAASWLVDKVEETMPSEAQRGGQGDDILFQSGRLGMWHTGIWMFGVLEEMEDPWNIAVEPGNTTRASHFFANAAVASSTTEHPEESAAWLQHLASSEVTVQQRLEGNWELPAVFDESLLAPYLEQSPPANRQAVFDSLDAVVVPPVVEKQQQLQDTVTQALERAVLGQVDVATALDEAASDVNGLLE
ncbi:MAG: sugar ABC transporter substrate-binding protein [Nitriliruptoraceae bacterium]